MTAIAATVDIDPTSNTILGTHELSQRMISFDRPVVVENAFFADDGIQGVILDEDDRRKLKGLKEAQRNEDGVLYTFDGRMPILTAAFVLLNPRKNKVYYTNAR
jgi:hypothetical protein